MAFAAAFLDDPPAQADFVVRPCARMHLVFVKIPPVCNSDVLADFNYTKRSRKMLTALLFALLRSNCANSLAMEAELVSLSCGSQFQVWSFLHKNSTFHPTQLRTAVTLPRDKANKKTIHRILRGIDQAGNRPTHFARFGSRSRRPD